MNVKNHHAYSPRPNLLHFVWTYCVHLQLDSAGTLLKALTVLFHFEVFQFVVFVSVAPKSAALVVYPSFVIKGLILFVPAKKNISYCTKSLKFEVITLRKSCANCLCSSNNATDFGSSISGVAGRKC